MVSKKYANDYRLENQLTERGTLKTVPVYIGKMYEFSTDSENLKRAKIQLAVFTFFAFACIFSGFMFNSDIGRTVYVAVPYAFVFLPIGFQLVVAVEVFVIKTPCTREKSERIYDRIAKCSFGGIFLSAIAIVGSIVKLILNYNLAVKMCNIIYLILLCLFLLCEIYVFIAKKQFKMTEIK